MPDAPHTDRRSFLAALAGVVAGCGGARRSSSDAAAKTAPPMEGAAETTPGREPSVVPYTSSPTPEPEILKPGEWVVGELSDFAFTVLRTQMSDGHLFALLAVKYIGPDANAMMLHGRYSFYGVDHSNRIQATLVTGSYFYSDAPTKPGDYPYMAGGYSRGEVNKIYRVSKDEIMPGLVHGVSVGGMDKRYIWRGETIHG